MGLSGYILAFIHLVSSFILLHLTFSTDFTYSIQPLCHDNERSALLQFKQSLGINTYVSSDPSAYPKVESWKPDKENNNCCLWDGIKCDEHTGYVVKLDLSSSFLQGSINSSSGLFQLVHLQWLSLADNDFNASTIPSGMINLARLSYLNLSFSVFSGQIPSEILELSKLDCLDVSRNHLELQNPSLTNLVEKLLNLNVLDLSYVKISSWIPPALTNLMSLTFLSLSGCELKGKVPPSIGNLSSILHLDISYNNFVGDLPTSIGNLRSLSYMDVQANSFTKIIPPSIGNLTNLLYLDISVNSLQGELPTSFGNLTQLTTFNLVNINLTGEIPSVLMKLTQLMELDLSYNELTGLIPSWLMNLNKLSVLVLEVNQLTGHIPVEIRNLTQLELLSLGKNKMEGSIPNSIYELKNLQGLDLSFNKLSGILDVNLLLTNLKSLYKLFLSSNKILVLTGNTLNKSTMQKFSVIGFSSCNLKEFPYFLHNQDQLIYLDLSSNMIVGQMPGWFSNISINNLLYLNLSNNLLTGFEQNLQPLPWKESVVDLSFNKLKGPLLMPSKYNFTYLISNNQLIGEILPQICSFNNLHALDLSYNNLSGKLPKCLGNLSFTSSVLKLQGNNIRGNIPEIFARGTNLRMIDLSNNALQGRLPQSLANCVKLKFLNLGNNQITGYFPSWLGTLPELEVLILKFNRFYGEIKEPKREFEFPKLRIIDLSYNRFAGNLPSKYFRCWNAMKAMNTSMLTYLQDLLVPGMFVQQLTSDTYYDFSLTLNNKGNEMEYKKLSNLITAIIFSNNNFVGEIPPSIANLKGLRTLDLSSNNVEGHIPSFLTDLMLLESLDLSNNKLSGEIPPQLAELSTLEFCNVSNNNLTGPVPWRNQLSTFDNRSFDGNPELCGEPLSRKCEKSEASQKEDSRSSDSLFVFGWKIVAIGYASGTIIGLVLGHIFSIRKHEWLAKTFGLQLNVMQRRRSRN